jgi:hypothetical protein
MVTRIAIDLDGVVTANPSALSWLTYHALKNENAIEVYILTWRDGSNLKRREETVDDLKRFGIQYTELLMAPRKFPNLRTAAFWKISQIKEREINIWLDDDLKSFTRDLGIDVDRLLPGVIKIFI